MLASTCMRCYTRATSQSLERDFAYTHTFKCKRCPKILVSMSIESERVQVFVYIVMNTCIHCHTALACLSLQKFCLPVHILFTRPILVFNCLRNASLSRERFVLNRVLVSEPCLMWYWYIWWTEKAIIFIEFMSISFQQVNLYSRN